MSNPNFTVIMILFHARARLRITRTCCFGNYREDNRLYKETIPNLIESLNALCMIWEDYNSVTLYINTFLHIMSTFGGVKAVLCLSIRVQFSAGHLKINPHLKTSICPRSRIQVLAFQKMMRCKVSDARFE